jgi:hypothetical protein
MQSSDGIDELFGVSVSGILAIRIHYIRNIPTTLSYGRILRLKYDQILVVIFETLTFSYGT